MTDVLTIKRAGNASADSLTRSLDLAFERALARESHISAPALSMEGMSGKLYRMFINNLIRLLPDPRYLEVGSWAGSTACAAMDRNVAKVLCIDDWSLFGGPKDRFFHNTDNHRSPNIDFRFIERDFRRIEVSEFGNKFNVYLFDGPHEKQDQYDGLYLFKNALDDNFIFIVDDWNWPFVRSGTLEAIRDVGYRIDFAIDVRTTVTDDHVTKGAGAEGDWHNGYFMSKLSRF